MREVNIILPKKWDELNNKQLIFVAKLFLSDFAHLPFKFLTHTALKFAGLKIKKVLHGAYILKAKGSKPFICQNWQVHYMANSLRWLHNEVTEIHPLKRLRFARPCHYRLYKTPFIQFLTAENFYTAYKTTNKVQHLNELCAVLYQKPGNVFNESLVKSRARYFKWISIYKKYTVFLWYSGFRYYVSKECPNLFNSSGSGSELDIKEHVLSMVRGLTDGDVTKNNDVQYNVDTWEALYELDKKAKHAEEMREKFKKNKTS